MFFGKRETRVKDLMVEHVQLVQKSVNQLVTLIEALIADDDDMESVSYDIHRLEHEADSIRRQIQKVLAEGAFLAFYREDYINLTERIDKIANRAVDFAKSLSLEQPDIPADLKDSLLKLAKANVETMEPFVTLTDNLFSDPKKVTEAAEQVSTGEQHSDSIEWKTQKAVYASKEIPRSEQIIISNTIQRLASVADVIENAADSARIIMAKQK